LVLPPKTLLPSWIRTREQSLRPGDISSPGPGMPFFPGECPKIIQYTLSEIPRQANRIRGTNSGFPVPAKVQAIQSCYAEIQANGAALKRWFCSRSPKSNSLPPAGNTGARAPHDTDGDGRRVRKINRARS